MRNLAFAASLCLLFGVAVAPSRATEIVRAEIADQSAWTGAPIALTVTLYSPGPFSGTANFALPEIPRTVILKRGNPVIGNETIDEDEWFTQRHSFSLFTQQVGEVTIPPFQVDFEGKKTFLADPEPMSGRTAELKFESKRPPGTDALGIVVAADKMNVTQEWIPVEITTVVAGDVIQRQVTRQATGTTAMILPPIPESAPDGVRVYSNPPNVKDKSTRGIVNSERVDYIKYQFESAGTYDLPAVNIVWWNSDAETLEQARINGLTVSVSPAPNAETAEAPLAEESPATTPLLLIFALAVGGGVWWLWLSYRRQFAGQEKTVEQLAAEQVLAASRSDDKRGFYAAFLAWQRAASFENTLRTESHNRLAEKVEQLGKSLYGQATSPSPVSLADLAAAFRSVRTERQHPHGMRAELLPALNPTRKLEG